MVLTGKQIRNGRVLARLRAQQLAARASISELTLWRIEQSKGEPMIRDATAFAIQRTLEAAGVEFTQGARPGVRLKNDRRPPGRPPADDRNG